MSGEEVRTAQSTFPWWWILLIVLATLFCCLVCILLVCLYRKRTLHALCIVKLTDDHSIGAVFEGNPGEELAVLEVDPDGAADGVLCVGDEIISINNCAMKKYGAEGAAQLLYQLAAGSYPVTLRRNGVVIRFVEDLPKAESRFSLAIPRRRLTTLPVETPRAERAEEQESAQSETPADSEEARASQLGWLEKAEQDTQAPVPKAPGAIAANARSKRGSVMKRV